MKQFYTAATNGLLLTGRGVILVASTELAAAYFITADSPISEQLLMRGVFTLILAILLLPEPELGKRPGVSLPISWSLLSGASVFVGLMWMPGISTSLSTALLLAMGTAALVLLFASLSLVLAYHFNDRRRASRFTLATLLLCLTLPLWAAPVAALYGSSKWLVDTVVALCPVSYLAALAKIDYLRGNWLYLHAPYGSLRFDYPDPVRATFLIVILSALTSILGRFQRLGLRPNKLPSVLSEPLEIKP
jgi:hypothetical protein